MNLARHSKVTGLQNCLTKLDSYTKQWKLNINFKKSKVLVFGTSTQYRLHSTSMWSINQNTLENVNEYCYLGITLHSSGNFKRAQKIIHGKALHAYHSIFKSFSNVENVPIKLMLKLFSSIVNVTQSYYTVAMCGAHIYWVEWTLSKCSKGLFEYCNPIASTAVK